MALASWIRAANRPKMVDMYWKCQWVHKFAHWTDTFNAKLSALEIYSNHIYDLDVVQEIFDSEWPCVLVELRPL